MEKPEFTVEEEAMYNSNANGILKKITPSNKRFNGFMNIAIITALGKMGLEVFLNYIFMYICFQNIVFSSNNVRRQLLICSSASFCRIEVQINILGLFLFCPTTHSLTSWRTVLRIHLQIYLFFRASFQQSLENH